MSATPAEDPLAPKPPTSAVLLCTVLPKFKPIKFHDQIKIPQSSPSFHVLCLTTKAREDALLTMHPKSKEGINFDVVRLVYVRKINVLLQLSGFGKVHASDVRID